MHWRQGDFVEPIDFAALEIDWADSVRAIVISHSCDLAGVDETTAELLVGEITEHQQYANGHSIKWLDLRATSPDKQEIVRFNINSRKQIERSKLLPLAPSASKIFASELSILKLWLAQRYNRAEFPDEFNKRLEVCADFEKKWAKKHSSALSGVYFDTSDQEITDQNEPYELKIYLVYASENTDNESKANLAKSELVDLLKRHYYQSSSWNLIELVGCEVISDANFSVRNARIYKRWRFEHRSIKGEPLDILD
jgi:hypothetical protein